MVLYAYAIVTSSGIPKKFLISVERQINNSAMRFDKKGIVFEIITGSPLFPF